MQHADGICSTQMGHPALTHLSSVTFLSSRGHPHCPSPHCSKDLERQPWTQSQRAPTILTCEAVSISTRSVMRSLSGEDASAGITTTGLMCSDSAEARRKLGGFWGGRGAGLRGRTGTAAGLKAQLVEILPWR